MSAEIPYTLTRRPDSGLTNPVLGLWLFLASEVMLFGSLLSSYALLRTAAGESWRADAPAMDLSAGAWKTVVLVLSSVTVYRAWRATAAGRRSARAWLLATVVLGTVFLGGKVVEMGRHVAHGGAPADSVAAAITVVLSGIHALHVLGGIFVALYLAGPGWSPGSRRFVQRVELTGTYWHFVDAVWLVLFTLFYLT